ELIAVGEPDLVRTRVARRPLQGPRGAGQAEVVEEKTGPGTGPGGRFHAAQAHPPQGARAPRGAVQEGELIDADEELLRSKREAQAVPAGAPAHERGAARERGGL